MKTHEMDWVVDPNATLTEIKRLLGAAEALVENGRFVLTVESERQSRDNYLFHHFRKSAYSHEDTKLVGKGSVQSCIKALGYYVAKHETEEKPYTTEQVAATLGLVLPKFDRRAVLMGNDPLTKAAAAFSGVAGPDMEPSFREGWDARLRKGALSPYRNIPEYSDQHHAWNEGWHAANRYLSA